MLNAILWKLRTGAPWRDLSDRYGLWKTAPGRDAVVAGAVRGPARGTLRHSARLAPGR
ncbi:hypothetical protein CKY47_31290 [Saccharothrix yanglingensis]|uniref:Insertion element IS402-like domain-containing protein n=1 Tax=Saccharothrix yanglingensis TaxID=659496 RepID=A0ABU0X8K0_9PSEU|nr:hypothetical protein [Saccharothrix yanglingensis]